MVIKTNSKNLKTNFQNNTVSEHKIVITTGLALFAMFFGAGNILFPLYLGANAGQHIGITTLGFLIAGVGVPFLGLIATSLFNGSYHAFFARLGKIPAFLLITFLMIIIGPLGALPRTEVTTFYALQPYLPNFLNNNAVFSLFYCGLVFLLAYREAKVVEILGLYLSPVKIISFTALIILGFISVEPSLPSPLSTFEAFNKAIMNGYNTMDLLGAFFYCTVAFKSIKHATHHNPTLSPTTLTLKSSMVGAGLTGAVYLGFMWIAHNHAASLQGLPEEKMISAISMLVLGKFGALFVCVSVSFACVATALALADVCSIYLYEEVFHKRVSKIVCLSTVMLLTYLMTNVGFQGILNITVPILKIVYPALIILCIFNILYKWKGVKMVKLPVLLTILIFAVILYLK
jgi:LIVCS family branched-chain amino acid:cation transporter